MKKFVAFLLASLLALALFACGGEPPTPTGNTPTQAPTQPGTGDSTGGDAVQDIYFAPKGVRLEIGAPPAPALEALKGALGEPLSERECPSCALKAKDIDYKYDGFVLTVTYPEEGSDYISAIKLSSDTYAAPGGITIGSSFEDMVAAYGAGYEDKGQGFYTYTQGISVLKFTILNDEMAQIKYEYDWDNA